jgi:hypothetical protein
MVLELFVSLGLSFLRCVFELVSGFCIPYMAGRTTSMTWIYRSCNEPWCRTNAYCAYLLLGYSYLPSMSFSVPTNTPRGVTVEEVDDKFCAYILILTPRDAVEIPIIWSHMSALVNWIRGDGFYSAYPKLTAANCSIVNPMIIIWYAITPTRVAKYLQKYVEHGFSIRLHPLGWPDDQHICHRAFNCSNTLRYTTDSGSLFIWFRSAPFQVIGDSVNKVVTSKTHCKLVWSLGEYKCQQGGHIMQPFILIQDLDVEE